MPTKHDEVARRIARKRRAEYNKGPGPDISTPSIAIEVESETTIPDAGRQLQGFRKPVYVAGATRNATTSALEHYRNSTIGVMDESGNIVKRSSRKRR